MRAREGKAISTEGLIEETGLRFRLECSLHVWGPLLRKLCPMCLKSCLGQVVSEGMSTLHLEVSLPAWGDRCILAGLKLVH